MPEKTALFVHVRDLKTHDIVHSVEFTNALTQRNLDKLEAGLLRRIDLDKYFLDTATVEMAIRRKAR